MQARHGVNDVLALKDADCSVAMASGSEAASQVAQVVLLDNDFSKELVSRIVELEKQARKTRISYNDAVERYNNNLILHKKVCMRFIHMKPLDTYKI